MKSSVFWDITPFSPLSHVMFQRDMLPPTLRLMNKPSKKQCERCELLLAICFMPASCSAYSLSLKVEATGLSETSITFHQTTQRYIPENRTPHWVTHLCWVSSVKLLCRYESAIEVQIILHVYNVCSLWNFTHSLLVI